MSPSTREGIEIINLNYLPKLYLLDKILSVKRLAVLEFRVYGHSIFTSPQKIVMDFVEKARRLKHVLDTETVCPLKSLIKEG